MKTTFLLSGFEIYLNGIKINWNQYRMENSKTIIFDSIPQTASTQTGLHVKIVKKNFLETNIDVNGWEQHFVDKILGAGFILYASNNDSLTESV